MYEVQLHQYYPATVTFGFLLVFVVAPFGGLPAPGVLVPLAFDPPLLLPPPLLVNEALVPLLPVAKDPTLPLDRSVPPPRPPVLRKLLLPLLLVLLVLPPPPAVLVLVVLLTLLPPPPLSDDVIDAAELLAVVALELEEREDERLPLSFPT